MGLSRRVISRLCIAYRTERRRAIPDNRIKRARPEVRLEANGMKTMIARALLGVSLSLASLSVLPAAVQAQSTSSNHVATKTDWSVFADKNPQECWGVSSPKSSENTRNGKTVTVKRGDILLCITFRAGQEDGEISFTGGYPFAKDSKVSVDIGGKKFDLFTQGQWAWTSGPDADATVMKAMKAGSKAVLTAHSSRGTQTVDTFSLLGFTAAMDDAQKRCK